MTIPFKTLVGCDLVNISRLEKSLQKEAFLKKVFHPNEILYCQGRTHGAPSFAARFAAKEALAKALGTGFYRQSIGPLQMWIENEPSGAPFFCYQECVAKALESKGVINISVSLSHNGDYAMAMVVLTCRSS